jgi:hypothetical protein
MRRIPTNAVTAATILMSALWHSAAQAQDAMPAPEAVPAPEVTPAQAPQESAPAAPVAPPRTHYSIPFMLRPVTVATVIRSDSSFARYENAKAQAGFAFVSELLGAVRIPGTGDAPGTGFAPIVKLAVVNDSPPGTATGGFAFVNPLVAASYAFALGSGFRVNTFLGFTIPVGMGGGDKPDAGALDARTVGQAVRSMLENSLFAVNDLAIVPGLDFAYVAQGFTAQLEVTLFQLERVRGSAADPDAAKTNLTGGIHLGYFLADALSIGAELRYQRWLQAPLAVQQNKPGTSVDQLSFGVGPRLHFALGDGVWIRPGVAYTRGFDAPMSRPMNDNIVQLDVPIIF